MGIDRIRLPNGDTVKAINRLPGVPMDWRPLNCKSDPSDGSPTNGDRDGIPTVSVHGLQRIRKSRASERESSIGLAPLWEPTWCERRSSRRASRTGSTSAKRSDTGMTVRSTSRFFLQVLETSTRPSCSSIARPILAITHGEPLGLLSTTRNRPSLSMQLTSLRKCSGQELPFRPMVAFYFSNPPRTIRTFGPTRSSTFARQWKNECSCCLHALGMQSGCIAQLATTGSWLAKARQKVPQNSSPRSQWPTSALK